MLPLTNLVENNIAQYSVSLVLLTEEAFQLHVLLALVIEEAFQLPIPLPLLLHIDFELQDVLLFFIQKLF